MNHEDQLLDIVRGLCAQVAADIQPGRIDLDTSLERHLGLGSLERVELLGRVETAFCVKLPQEAITMVDTPRQLLALIHSRQSPESTSQRTDSTPKGWQQATTTWLPASPPKPPPASATTLIEVLAYHARHHSERVHMLILNDDRGDEAITYGQLAQRAQAVAMDLRKRGLVRQGKVALMLPTSLGYFASFLGVLLAGGVPVPLYPPFRLDRIAEYVTREAKILINAQAQFLITFRQATRVAQVVKDRVPILEDMIGIEDILAPDPSQPSLAMQTAELSATDTALLQYTSGSTSDPKGVELSHANVLANIRAGVLGCGLQGDDVCVSWLPLYHDMGLIGGWLMHFYFGNPTILLSPVAFLTRPACWLETLTKFKATISVAPNFAFDLCIKRVDDATLAKLNLHRVRAILNGSEPILPSTLERFARRFAPAGFRPSAFFCAYGLAENMVAVTFPPLHQAPWIDRIAREPFEREGKAIPVDEGNEPTLQFVSVGSAIADHEIRIVDEQEQPVPERQQGQLQFRGPSAFKGYFANPEATAQVKRADGWINSGDLGYLAHGQFFITGRIKDLIIKGGRNYYPHEIEAAAATVPGIRQGCVAAFAGQLAHRAGESIIVVAETRTQGSPSQQQALIREIRNAVLDAVGIPPDEVRLVAPGCVPKTSSGKIRRQETRLRYQQGRLEANPGSFTRQATRLYLLGVPQRIKKTLQTVFHYMYGSYAATAVTTVVGASISQALCTSSGPSLRHVARRNARIALRMLGIPLKIIGQENFPSEPAVLVANHASYLDALIVLASFPEDVRYIIKGELRKHRILGPIIQRSGHLFIERQNTAQAMSDLNQAHLLLKQGHSVVIFPEGTFRTEVGLLPFRLGAFRLACAANVPIVPIAIRGARKALPDNTWMVRRSAIEVEVLPHLHPSGQNLEDILDLQRRASEQIAKHIDEPRLTDMDNLLSM